MPSDSETLGFVVLESMASGVPAVGCNLFKSELFMNGWQASGVPVVGCNRGGIPSLINDGKTGFLFEPGDSEPFISVD